MEFNSNSGSVYSKNIGSQFRLKYNNILENENLFLKQLLIVSLFYLLLKKRESILEHLIIMLYVN